jgi:hypothetical protein
MPDPLHGPQSRPPKGIDLGEALVLFAHEKLVISSKAPGAREHLTVHFGPQSGVLDVHQTHTAADGTKTYQTLFKIAYTDLERMMQELAGPIVESLRSVARPLTLEYMEKLGIGAIVGPLPTQANLGAAIEVRKRRLTINDEKLAAEYSAPKYLDELYDLEEGKMFILISRANRRNPHRVGFGFPVTDRGGRRRLVWLPDRRLAQEIERIETLLGNVASRYGNKPHTNDPPTAGESCG